MSYNINRNVEDVFYRYKMPRLQAKVEGKGNGIKTVIANMADIAKALNRPANYATKYFGCELGAQTQMDMKNDRYIVNGDHDQAKLQDTLDGFIKRFVLCQNCENPETSLKVRGKQAITQSCKACGHVGYIDMKHKLTAFIQKNPPAADDNADSSAGRKKGPEGDGSGEEKETNGLSNGDAADEEDWQPEVDGDGVGEQLTDRMKALIVHADLDKSIDERLDMFYNWLQAHQKSQNGAELDGKAIADEAYRLDVKDKATLLLAGVLYSVDSLVADIAKYRAVVLRFTHENHRAQKYLIGGVEQKMVAVPNKKAALIKQTPLILKALYDNDVVEEEVILGWGKKVSKKYVSRDDSKAIIEAAKPLLTWLAEAEEESDESDEDDVVQFDTSKGTGERGAVNGAPTTLTNGKTTAVGGAESDEEDTKDDLNIDDI